MITAISTAYNPPLDARARCFASVPAFAEHVYIDAAEQDPPLSHFENLLEAAAELPDDAIVVSLDGDDWLTPGALERVQAEYDAGALVTYGSFKYADGRPGFARQLEGDPRTSPWVTTHLKTFRAGLFRRIDPRHLQDAQGRWLEHARDLALMFPLLELAGPRAHFVPDVLYVYNSANSTEVLHPETKEAELEAVRYVRELPRYERLA